MPQHHPVDPIHVRLVARDRAVVNEAELEEPTPPRHIEYQGRMFDPYVIMPDARRNGEPIVVYVEATVGPVYHLHG